MRKTEATIYVDVAKVGNTTFFEPQLGITADIPSALMLNISTNGIELLNCFSIEDRINDSSWLTIVTYDVDQTIIQGLLHLNFVVTDLCGLPSENDTISNIELREFSFTASIN